MMRREFLQAVIFGLDLGLSLDVVEFIQTKRLFKVGDVVQSKKFLAETTGVSSGDTTGKVKRVVDATTVNLRPLALRKLDTLYPGWKKKKMYGVQFDDELESSEDGVKFYYSFAYLPEDDVKLLRNSVV